MFNLILTVSCFLPRQAVALLGCLSFVAYYYKRHKWSVLKSRKIVYRPSPHSWNVLWSEKIEITFYTDRVSNEWYQKPTHILKCPMLVSECKSLALQSQWRPCVLCWVTEQGLLWGNLLSRLLFTSSWWFSVFFLYTKGISVVEKLLWGALICKGGYDLWLGI